MEPEQSNENLQKLEEQQLMSNPFEGKQYLEMNSDNRPMEMQGSSMAELLSDNDVPDMERKKYWWVFKRDVPLSFLDRDRKIDQMLNFDISKIDMTFCMNWNDYTFEQESEYNVMRNMFETKLNRAEGVNTGNTKNERIMLQSQFHEQRHINQEGQGSEIKSGFFKRLLNRK